MLQRALLRLKAEEETNRTKRKAKVCSRVCCVPTAVVAVGGRALRLNEPPKKKIDTEETREVSDGNMSALLRPCLLPKKFAKFFRFSVTSNL